MDKILQRDPKNLEALTTFSSIDVQLQDYAVVERLYRQALRLHSSPAVAKALASLSK